MENYARTIAWILAGLLFVSLAGFNKSYFGLFPNFTGTSWVVHFHVFTIFCWWGLLLAQATLAKQQRFDLHRRVGRLSYILVPLIVVGFVGVTNFGQLRHKSPELLGATLFDASLFLIFYILAIANRKNTAYHARFMILSALPFINPGLGRFISPALSVPLEFLLILAFFLNARFKKEPYQPYLVGLFSFVLMLGLIVYISMINPAILESVWMGIWG